MFLKTFCFSDTIAGKQNEWLYTAWREMVHPLRCTYPVFEDHILNYFRPTKLALPEKKRLTAKKAVGSQDSNLKGNPINHSSDDMYVCLTLL